MIIFGFGNSYNKDFGEAFPAECENCDNHVVYHLVRVRYWFSLFFIPIFPYETEYYLLCPICENGIELERDKEIDASKEMCDYSRKLIDKEISKKEYKKEVEKLLKEIKFLE